jgi:hypothetical protein
MSMADILAALVRLQARTKKKKRIKVKKPARTPVKAVFTAEERQKVLWNALYGNVKTRQVWWRLLLLCSWPNIPQMAEKLHIPREQLEREYNQFKKGA